MSSVLASAWSLVVWFGLVVSIVHLVRAHRAHPPPSDRIAWLWRGLAVVSFALTWSFMIEMTIEDLSRHPSLGAWSHDSNLFFDAYRRVTETSPAWWWSQHLMGWALPGALWITVEGRRLGVRAWAYLWLATCVAVSVAFPFFAQRLRAGRTSAASEARVPTALAGGLALAGAALVATPLLSGAPFLVAMVVLHAAILIPVVTSEKSARTLPTRPIALGVGVICLVIHVVATLRLSGHEASELLNVVLRDPAQRSITSDVFVTWIAGGVFVALKHDRRRAALFLLLAPLVSLGAAFIWAIKLGAPDPSRR